METQPSYITDITEVAANGPTSGLKISNSPDSYRISAEGYCFRFLESKGKLQDSNYDNDPNSDTGLRVYSNLFNSLFDQGAFLKRSENPQAESIYIKASAMLPSCTPVELGFYNQARSQLKQYLSSRGVDERGFVEDGYEDALIVFLCGSQEEVKAIQTTSENMRGETANAVNSVVDIN